jgi:dTDP-4-amino-4,6-dideoxygalactose transaminase
MKKLAIHGGSPVRSKPFPAYRTIGQEEKRAVSEVLDSGILSGFLGSWTPDFYGGPRVRKLEREWSEYFGAKHAITVNSATSGLNAAVGASGVGPGDEVIVSPYTMSASAACVLVYNAIPVFADIDPETFCVSAGSIRKCLSPRTKAIVIVDLFGHPFDRDEVMTLAQEHNLVVIEDAAQAPGALYRDHYAGTLADIGVFSLNCHKTIHTGEGGVIVTDDDNFAERLQLIRNHAEHVVSEKRGKNLVNMLGFNYRMTEIEAAIGSEQLKKLDRLLQPRIDAAGYLTERLRHLPGLTPPVVRTGVRHGYYVYAIRYDARQTGIPRDRFIRALNAEGIPMTGGYVEPIYLQPLYQERTLYGTSGCPFSCSSMTSRVRYDRGICPVTERMYNEELMLTNICHADITRGDLEDALTGIEKVLEYASDFDCLEPQQAAGP